MSTNYNQLLKDLEIGSVYVKILICFLGCTFMLYPFLCYFTHFFGSSPYMNRSFHIRQFCPIPGSWTSILHYGTCQISCLFYTPMILLTCAIVICILYIYRWIFFSASIIMHSTVFRISVSHYHRGNSRFQREKDF